MPLAPSCNPPAPIAATELSGAKTGAPEWPPIINRAKRIWKEDNAAARTRSETLRATRYYGSTFWKRWTGYHVRSRIEARVCCLTSFGERIMARDPDRQTAEIYVRIAFMNRFSEPGTAEIIRVA